MNFAVGPEFHFFKYALEKGQLGIFKMVDAYAAVGAEGDGVYGISCAGGGREIPREVVS